MVRGLVRCLTILLQSILPCRTCTSRLLLVSRNTIYGAFRSLLAIRSSDAPVTVIKMTVSAARLCKSVFLPRSGGDVLVNVLYWPTGVYLMTSVMARDVIGIVCPMLGAPLRSCMYHRL